MTKHDKGSWYAVDWNAVEYFKLSIEDVVIHGILRNLKLTDERVAALRKRSPKGYVVVSVPTLSKQIGKSVSTVKRSIAKLEEREIITKKRGNFGHCNQYTVLTSLPWNEPAPVSLTSSQGAREEKNQKSSLPPAHTELAYSRQYLSEEVVSTPPEGGAQTTELTMLAPGLSRGLGAPAGAAYQGKGKETDKDPEIEAYVEYGSADVSPMAKRAQSMVRDFMKELDKDPGAEWKKNWLSWVRLASDHPALLTDKEKEQIRGLFRKIKDGYEARDVFAIIRKRILKMNH